MRFPTDPSNRKQWVLPTVLFFIGAILGVPFLAVTSSDVWTNVLLSIEWLLVPGFILLVPAYVLAGGVHGDHIEIVFRLVPLANGLAYALMAIIARRIFERRKTKKACSSN